MRRSAVVTKQLLVTVNGRRIYSHTVFDLLNGREFEQCNLPHCLIPSAIFARVISVLTFRLHRRPA